MAYVKAYPRFMKGLWNGLYDMDGTTADDVFKVMLVASSYTFDPTDITLDLISGSEITGTGYADGFAGSGRKTLTTKAIVETLASSLITWKADSVTWTGIDAGTFDAAVIFHQPAAAASDADCVPVAYCYTGAVATSGSDVTLTVDSTYGILQHQG